VHVSELLKSCTAFTYAIHGVGFYFSHMKYGKSWFHLQKNVFLFSLLGYLKAKKHVLGENFFCVRHAKSLRALLDKICTDDISAAFKGYRFEISANLHHLG
jgi:hypothetical protein